MKIYFVAVALVCLGFIEARAQTGKGSFLIGGSVNLARAANDTQIPPGAIAFLSSNSAFSISPTVGYFVVNNFMVGLQPSVSFGWRPDYKDVKSQTYSVGPILRYYFPFGKFAVFPEVAGGYNFERQQNVTVGLQEVVTTHEARSTSYRAGAGIAWFAAPSIGIEGILAYRQNNFITDGGSQSLIYFNVGLQFYLNRNK